MACSAWRKLFVYSVGGLMIMSVVFGMMMPVKIYAQTEEDATEEDATEEDPTSNLNAHIPQLVNPVGTTDISSIVARITKAILGMIGTVSFLIFVASGIQLILSEGSEDKVKKAKDSMVWAVIGIAISLGSYAILTNVLDVLTKGR